MGSIELRPLSVGELLDRTFTLYRRFFPLFLGISALPQVLVLALNLTRTFFSSPPALRALSAPSNFQAQGTAASTGGIITSVVLGLALLVVSVIAYLLSQGATVTAVAEIYLGRTITIGDSFRRVRGELGTLLGVVLLNGLATGAAFILLIIPGIYVMCRLVVCIPAALVENIGPRDSLERSWGLTKDNAGRAFLILLLYFVVLFAAEAIFAWPFGILVVLARNTPSMSLFWLEMTQVGTTVAAVLISPILTIASSVLYFDLRIRKEAFDLQMMMKPLGGGVPSASPAPTLLS